jgi:4-diphosphocytidyl-2-C-methyl-D-erythritol kinase
MSEPVVRLAPAKLNLTLAVVGRRSDGFHDLHSVFVPLDLADRLSLAPGTRVDTLHVVGADTGPIDANLVLRGIAAARAAVGEGPGKPPAPPLAARLDKRIPVAAGLGGGSSDGHAAFDAALEAWGVGDDVVDPARRRAAAATIGSDVPFFAIGGPALVPASCSSRRPSPCEPRTWSRSSMGCAAGRPAMARSG